MMTKLSVGEAGSKLQLPNDWSEIKIQKLLDKGLLIDHLDGNHGELYPSAEEFSDEGVPYVSANNFSNGVVDLEGCKKLPEARAKQFKKGIARNEDVIFAHNATVGPVALLKTDLDYVILGTTATYYRCNNDKLLNHYLLYAMQSNFFVKQYSKVMFQSTRSQVPITAQRKLSLLIPSYPEQKAIAQVLSTADAAILTTEKLIAQKELRKKWLMQQLLTGEKRLKGFGAEWKEHSYEKILKVVKRNFDWDENELYKLISVRRRSGGIFYREALYGHQILVKTLRTANEGDFLFSKMQILHGASALVTKDFDGAKISGSYIAVVPKEKKQLNMEFFQWYSQTPYFYHQTYISSYGVHIEKMTFDFDTFLQLKMKLPSIEEQTAIAQVLQAADKEISLLKAKAEKLREQKKGLMQQLLTGKVRLKIK
jgi:type I restriction enzyme S subunit